MQRFESQLQTAATKDEALRLAISVAENLVKAIKLSSSVEQKKQLKAKCGVIMDTADRIKKSENWTPLAHLVRQDVKQDQVEQWAANVSPGSPPHHVSSAQSSVVSDTLVYLSYRWLNANPSDSLDKTQPMTDLQVDEGVMNGLSIAQPLKAKPKIAQRSASPPMYIQRDEQLQESPVASQPRVRKLAAPVSTRKMTKKEQILLLRASVVNGFKCPPWDEDPASSEFALREGAYMFT
jgi:calpain-7